MRIQDARVGMFVQSKTTEKDRREKFIGTVEGLSVNAFGEAVLLVKFIENRLSYMTREFIEKSENHSVVIGDHSGKFVERFSPIHPGNVEPLTDGSTLAKSGE